MDTMTPGELGMIVALGALGLGVNTLWHWREPIIDGLRRVIARYVTPRPSHPIAHEGPFSPFERAERPPFVQTEQMIAEREQGAIEATAVVLALGGHGEGALIEAVFGVKRGGSARYLALRDAVRARAAGHGWKAPAPAEPPRVITVNAGRPEERELPMEPLPR